MTELRAAKYFKGEVHHCGRVYPVVIWDGKRDYDNDPPIAALMIVEKLTGKVVVAQIHNRKCGREFASTMFVDGVADSLVIWARDTKTYRAITNNLKDAAVMLRQAK